MKFYQNKREHEIKVGIFTLVAIIILFAGYLWLTNAMNLHKYQELNVSFQEANGLEKGTGVFIRGINCGKVDQILLRENDVLISLLIKVDIPLRDNSRFYIADSDLMGNKIIKIVPSNSRKAMDLSQIQIGENSAQITDLLSEVGKITTALTEMFPDKGNSIFEEFKYTLSKGNETLEKIDKLVSDNSEEINQTVVNFKQISHDLNEIIASNKSELIDSGDLIIQVKDGLNQIDSTFVEIDGLLESIKSESSSIKRLMTEEELYNSLLKSSEDLDSLLIDIKLNPKRYFKLF